MVPVTVSGWHFKLQPELQWCHWWHPHCCHTVALAVATVPPAVVTVPPAVPLGQWCHSSAACTAAPCSALQWQAVATATVPVAQ